MESAIETGDPNRWPEILRVYREHPSVRWAALWHLRIYWQEQAELVVPLVREALQDPEVWQVALESAAYFPQLAADVAACLTMPASRRRWRAGKILATLACQ